MSTQFGVHPDSNSPLARKIKAIVEARDHEERLLAAIAAAVASGERRNAARRIARFKTVKHLMAFHRGQKGIVRPRYVEILAEVAAKYDLTTACVVGRNRTQRFTVPRFEAMWRLYSETEMSIPRIAFRLGGRNHTSVLHGVKVYMQRNGIVERPAHRRQSCNRNPAWTPERAALAVKMHEAGETFEAIRAELGGGLTRNAVIGKISRLTERA